MCPKKLQTRWVGGFIQALLKLHAALCFGNVFQLCFELLLLLISLSF